MIHSLSVVNGYNKHMKGFPKITLSIIFLTKIKAVLKHVLSWHRWAFWDFVFNLHLTTICKG